MRVNPEYFSYIDLHADIEDSPSSIFKLPDNKYMSSENIL